MSAEKFPFLDVNEGEEEMLFTTALQDQARIGHLRGDFGRGTEFWTTWWDRHTELKGQEFKDELDDLVNTLRKKGPLKNLSAMQKFCQEHPQAQMSARAGSHYYAFRINTKQHRYYLRFFPEKTDYNFYIFCYRTDKFEKDLPVPDFSYLRAEQGKSPQKSNKKGKSTHER